MKNEIALSLYTFYDGIWQKILSNLPECSGI